MKTIYSLCSEINNNGQYNSDKNFPTPELANKYLRKLAANTVCYLRKRGFIVKYINVYKFDNKDNEFPATIEIGGFNNINGWERYDMRVQATVLFESEKEFDTFPIRF